MKGRKIATYKVSCCWELVLGLYPNSAEVCPFSIVSVTSHENYVASLVWCITCNLTVVSLNLSWFVIICNG